MHEIRAPLVLSVAAALSLAVPAQAADELMNASQERLLDAVEETLLGREISVLERAQTDRFALIYAAENNGSHITISVRQLPADPDRARISITSDSPANPNLDRALLNALSDAIEAD